MFWKKKKNNKKDNVCYAELKVEVPINLSPDTYIKAINVIEKEKEISVHIGDKISYLSSENWKTGIVIGSYFSIGWRESDILGWHVLVSELKDGNTSGVIDEISLSDIQVTEYEKRIKETDKHDIVNNIRTYCATACLYECDNDCPLKKYKI